MSGSNKIIQAVENAQLRSDLPQFGAGDTVTVNVKVKEGDRERVQAFQGTVIRLRGGNVNAIMEYFHRDFTMSGLAEPAYELAFDGPI